MEKILDLKKLLRNPRFKEIVTNIIYWLIPIMIITAIIYVWPHDKPAKDNWGRVNFTSPLDSQTISDVYYNENMEFYAHNIVYMKIRIRYTDKANNDSSFTHSLTKKIDFRYQTIIIEPRYNRITTHETWTYYRDGTINYYKNFNMYNDTVILSKDSYQESLKNICREKIAEHLIE